MKKLTEKDAIWCKTQKQWDAIIEMFDLKVMTAFNRNCICILYPSEKGISACSAKEFAKNKGYTIHKAKDILNKSKIKQLEKRVSKIEKHFSENTTIETNQPRYIETQLSPMGLPTKELEELPEKWCVKSCENNINEIAKFFNRGIDEVYNNIRFLNKYFHSHNLFNGIHILDIIGSGWNFCESYITEGYTEITFDQFKKWVLKEENPVELLEELLSEVTEEDAEKVKEQMISMDEEEKPLSIREVQVKVSSQEEANECAEIAKACGEKIFFSNSALDVTLFNNYFKGNKQGIFFVGRKSETKKEISLQEFRERFGKKQETEIDWSKAGQLVVSKEPITKILTLGNHKENVFSGVQVEDNGFFRKGYFTESWRKENFKLCTEPITLKNE